MSPGARGRPGGARPPAASLAPALVFDGECRFCTACVLWARRRSRRPIELLPWQALAARGGLAAYGLGPEEARGWAWWVEEGRRWRGHRAAGRALLACGGGWRLLGRVLLAPPPLAWAFALGYALVSRVRGSLGGVRPACRRERWPPAEGPRRVRQDDS